MKWPNICGEIAVLRDIVGYRVEGKEGLAGKQRNHCLNSSLKGALERPRSRWENNIKVDCFMFF